VDHLVADIGLAPLSEIITSMPNQWGGGEVSSLRTGGIEDEWETRETLA